MSSLDPSTGLTCVTCCLVFKTADLQRDHYRTEWHRYNLKRQFAGIAPVTEQQFNDKVVKYRGEQKEKTADIDSTFYCSTCNKYFTSQNTFDNHIKSRRHIQTEKHGIRGPRQPKKKTPSTPSTPSKAEPEPEPEIGDEDADSDSSGWETDDGEEEYDETKALPTTHCLFCPKTSTSYDDNMDHMKARHGFDIPDKEYCTDAEGLVEYLGLKVGAGNFCIFCPETKSRFQSLESVQKHMVDKSHCKLSTQPKALLELAEYYDYTALAEELEHAKTPVVDGYTLVLPSGAKIGHRAFLRYYQQYVRGNSGQLAVMGVVKDPSIKQTAALSWIGGSKAVAQSGAASRGQLVRAAKDIALMERARRRFELRRNVWSNKLFKTRGRVGDN